MNGKCILALAGALLTAACGGGPCGGSPPPSGVSADHPLLNPDSPAMRQEPPDTFDVRFATSQGEVVVRVYREWAPLGARRFYNLVRNGFYDDSRFFRVIEGFVAQFGVSGEPAVDQLWNERPMRDDPPRVQNRAGTLVYAKVGEDSRTTQLFVNYRDNEGLNEQGFAPIGIVTEGMPVLRRLYAGYGDTPPTGRGPAFSCMLSHGNEYLDRKYPQLDRIERAVVVDSAPTR